MKIVTANDVASFVFLRVELLGGFSWRGNDVLVLQQFGLTADAGIAGPSGSVDGGALPIIFIGRNWLVDVDVHRRSGRGRRRQKPTFELDGRASKATALRNGNECLHIHQFWSAN